jgi:hypothetical protein
MEVKGIECEILEWVRTQWQAVAKTIINFGLHKRHRN